MPNSRSVAAGTGVPFIRQTFFPSVEILRVMNISPLSSGLIPFSSSHMFSAVSGVLLVVKENTAVTDAKSAPVLMISRDVLYPVTADRESMTIDLPAPVSPSGH